MADASTASVLMTWKGKGDDARLFRAGSDDGVAWSSQALAGTERGTSHGPALATVQGLSSFPNSVTAMAWKGMGDDPALYWSLGQAGSWQAQRIAGDAHGPFQSSAGPTLGIVQGMLVMAWKGARHFEDQRMASFTHPVPDDPRLFWATHDGSAWSERELIAGGSIGSSHRPPLVGIRNQAVLAWKGKGNDARLFWALYDGHAWSSQQLIASVGSSHGPGLAYFKGRVYMAWKGAGADPQLYWSTLSQGKWDAQRRVREGAFGTSHEPALAVVKGKLLLAWKGVGDDPRLFCSLFDGNDWTDQQEINAGAIGTSHGPALTSLQIFNL
jgi:hypothetical protein